MIDIMCTDWQFQALTWESEFIVKAYTFSKVFGESGADFYFENKNQNGLCHCFIN